MVGGQRLRRHDDLVKVALHQLCDDVAAGPLRTLTEPDQMELKRVRTAGRIHLLEAVDLRRLQDVQSRQNLQNQNKT